MENTGTLDGIVDRPNHANHAEVILAVNDAAKRLCDHVLVLDDQDGDGRVYLICTVGQLSHQAHPLPCANGRDPMMILMGRLEGCNGGVVASSIREMPAPLRVFRVWHSGRRRSSNALRIRGRSSATG